MGNKGYKGEMGGVGTMQEGLGSQTTVQDLCLAAEITSKPPFVGIESLHNFRDIGGWDVDFDFDAEEEGDGDGEGGEGEKGDGQRIRGRRRRRVRKGILYRSPDFNNLTPLGEHQIRKDLKVNTIIDLRSTPQITRAGGVREIEGIERIWCPIFGEEMYSSANAGRRYGMYCGDGEGIVAAFEEIMECGGRASFVPLLQHLASLNPSSLQTQSESQEKVEIQNRHSIPTPRPEQQATIIHCTTGNNRTGVLIALLLSLLGVPDQQIAEEYSLSHHGLTPSREQTIDRLMKNRTFLRVVGDGEEGRRKAAGMVGARRENMLVFLRRVRERWGGVEGWVGRLGVSGEVIKVVRGVLVEVVDEGDDGDEDGNELRGVDF